MPIYEMQWIATLRSSRDEINTIYNNKDNMLNLLLGLLNLSLHVTNIIKL